MLAPARHAVPARNRPNDLELAQTLQVQGRLDEAIALYRQALTASPRLPALHYNLGTALHAQGRLIEAIASYRRALALAPDLVVAHNNLGNATGALGRLDEAAASYGKALELEPDHIETYYNLGVVLQAQGKHAEAGRCYERVLAARPDLAAAHNNLGNAREALGEVDGALASYRRALALEETPAIRANFAKCIRHCNPAVWDAATRALLARAVNEAWTRPATLARVGIQAVCADPRIAACVARAARAWPARLPGDDLSGADELRSLCDDTLLRALLENASVCDVAMERFLTMVRHAMLDAAMNASGAADGATLSFYCAIARQCFLNEFVWACTQDEMERASGLRAAVERAALSGEPIAVVCVAAVAAYFDLGSLSGAQALAGRNWPEAVRALFVQQVDEPAAERNYRAEIPHLTPVVDPVSALVRHHYEEHPYPRWTRLLPTIRQQSVLAYLRERFPLASFPAFDEARGIDFLIAGCGTGQESIDTAQQFPGARILAIDLSVVSLGYARRKTIEADLHNVEYAQGDILELGRIERRFEVVSSEGVLHHLADPGAGLRVLASLVRPGGFMRLGFYSEAARRDVVSARAFIAARGYGANAVDMRRCRQELIDEGERFDPLLSLRDFYTMSECRDLLFHEQEHRLTLPALKAMLDECGLQLIGFLLEAPVIQRYRERFPGDPAAISLTNWQRFENEYPYTFAGMYRFWVSKPALGVSQPH